MTQREPPNSCPGCGRQQSVYRRYPWYFCGECLAGAEDCDGRKLEFFNASFSGGLSWRYRHGADDHEGGADVASVICLTDGRPVLVMEARMGGVVAQPALEASLELGQPDAVDLTQRHSKPEPGPAQNGKRTPNPDSVIKS